MKEYTQERRYHKIPELSRKKGGVANKGTSIFTKEYQGLTWNSRAQKAAKIASDNGRCWWIYDYIMGDNRAQAKDVHKVYKGSAKEIYPTWNKK